MRYFSSERIYQALVHLFPRLTACRGWLFMLRIKLQKSIKIVSSKQRHEWEAIFYLFLLKLNGQSQSPKGIANISTIFKEVRDDGFNLLGSTTQVHHFTGEIHALLNQGQVLALKKETLQVMGQRLEAPHKLETPWTALLEKNHIAKNQDDQINLAIVSRFFNINILFAFSSKNELERRELFFPSRWYHLGTLKETHWNLS